MRGHLPNPYLRELERERRFTWSLLQFFWYWFAAVARAWHLANRICVHGGPILVITFFLSFRIQVTHQLWESLLEYFRV